MLEKNRESTPRFVPESIRRYIFVGPSMFGKPSRLLFFFQVCLFAMQHLKASIAGFVSTKWGRGGVPFWFSFETITRQSGPSTVSFLGGSPTKIDYRKKGTLILTSLLEDLDQELAGSQQGMSWEPYKPSPLNKSLGAFPTPCIPSKKTPITNFRRFHETNPGIRAA